MTTGAGDASIWYALAGGFGFILLLTVPSLQRTLRGAARRGDLASIAVAGTIVLSGTLLLLRAFR